MASWFDFELERDRDGRIEMRHEYSPRDLERLANDNATVGAHLRAWRNGTFQSFQQMLIATAIELAEFNRRLLKQTMMLQLSPGLTGDGPAEIRAGTATVTVPAYAPIDEAKVRQQGFEAGQRAAASFERSALAALGIDLGPDGSDAPAETTPVSLAEVARSICEKAEQRLVCDYNAAACDPFARNWQASDQIAGFPNAVVHLDEGPAAEEKPYAGLNGVDPTTVKPG